MQASSANFEFLRGRSQQLFRLAAQAEHYFRTDPNASLVKLRQFAELMAREVGARTRSLRSPDDTLVDLLGELGRSGYVPRQSLDLFHYLRKAGNQAAHSGLDDFATALTALKVGRELGAWYVRGYCGDPTLVLDPFVPPPPPADPTASLRNELERLRAEADSHRSAAELAQARAEALAQANLAASDRLRQEAEDRRAWQQLAEEAEAAATEVRAALVHTQKVAEGKPASEIEKLEQAAEAADQAINLDEAATRDLIDQQLRAAGWEADTRSLRFAVGARPVKGANRAIAEWPTASGPVDYALFCGLTLMATVEAKRRNRNVMGVLRQAERYARDLQHHGSECAEEGPWGDYQAPFAFSSNGRPYLKQIAALSGIWRRDLRDDNNPAEVLSGWPTPRGLIERLAVDKRAAAESLAKEPFDFGFPLRPYQKAAIEAVEAALAKDQREMLVAMATGTGKTKLAIAMLYRLIAARRFRRVCFIVDRSALGDQTEREFTTTKVVSGKAFADIFGLKGLSEVAPDEDTRIHICTIQGLVRRVLYPQSTEDAPPIDQYDLMVVDECHRGYLLDREMSEGDLTFRSQEDYVSKYRRVLEHFET